MTPTGDDHVRAGLEHLQAAALELIAATRAFLDVAEELIKEPSAATAVVRTVASLAAAVRAELTPQAPGPVEDRVRHIRLS